MAHFVGSPTRRSFVSSLAGTLAARAASAPRVVAEEALYDYVPPDNGAGPLWSYGAPLLVRHGNLAFAAALETVPGVKPLNNCRWSVYCRADNTWRKVISDEKGRQREPSPIGVFGDGRLIVSVNPTLTEPGVYNGPADPHLLTYSVTDLEKAPATLRPFWGAEIRLTEHTYRGLGVDPHRHELLLVQNDGRHRDYSNWTFLDRRGEWRSHGTIDYPVRGCYPQIALSNGAAHVLAVGDIVEPVIEWRKWKFEQTHRDWDYVFRRLFYAWNPNVATQKFRDVVEIANVDETAGRITNLDLWIAPDGAAHLLYLQRRVQDRAMRDRFFPHLPLTTTLEYCVMRNGRVESRRTLVSGDLELAGSELPVYARLHATANQLLLAIVTTRSGRQDRMKLIEVWPAAKSAEPVALEMQHPMITFMTATERGGSPPSDRIDLMGQTSAQPNTIRYALIQL